MTDRTDWRLAYVFSRIKVAVQQLNQLDPLLGGQAIKATKCRRETLLALVAPQGPQNMQIETIFRKANAKLDGSRTMHGVLEVVEEEGTKSVLALQILSLDIQLLKVLLDALSEWLQNQIQIVDILEGLRIGLTIPIHQLQRYIEDHPGTHPCTALLVFRGLFAFGQQQGELTQTQVLVLLIAHICLGQVVAVQKARDNFCKLLEHAVLLQRMQQHVRHGGMFFVVQQYNAVRLAVPRLQFR